MSAKAGNGVMQTLRDRSKGQGIRVPMIVIKATEELKIDIVIGRVTTYQTINGGGKIRIICNRNVRSRGDR